MPPARVRVMLLAAGDGGPGQLLLLDVLAPTEAAGWVASSIGSFAIPLAPGAVGKLSADCRFC
eukprot:4568358-Prymnesium_polylepis.1